MSLKWKNILFLILALLFAAALFISPATGLASARDALFLFGRVVVPSLLPFFICVSVISETGFVRVIAALLAPVGRILFGLDGYAVYALLSSFAAGCPAGAAVTAALFRDGYIDEAHARRTACFTLTAGPMFITGTVAVSFLSGAQYGPPLFFSHILGAVFSGFVLSVGAPVAPRRRYLPALREEYAKFRDTLRSPSFDGFSALRSACVSSVSTLLTVGALIILFSVIGALLRETGAIAVLSAPAAWLLKLASLDPAAAPHITVGLLEMTTGTAGIGGDGGIDAVTKLYSCAFIMGFSGLSAIAQARAALSAQNIKAPLLMAAKLLHALSSCFILKLMLTLTDLSVPAATGMERAAPAYFLITSLAAIALCGALLLYSSLFLSSRRLSRTRSR